MTEVEKVDIGTALSNNYMLAKLNVRIWSARKTDKTATAELLSNKGAVSNAASVVKHLLAGNEAKLKETAAAYTRIRTFFYEATVPWTTASVGAMKGDRLISTAESINFLGDFARLKNEATASLNEFLQEYDALVQNSSSSLGGLYDVSEYPTKAQVAVLFGAEMSLNPLPEATDFDRLTNIPASLAAGLKGLYEKNMEAQMENALSDVQKRLLGELERMDTQLSKVAAGEKTRLFKSMVTNLKHLTGMARSLNFTNNPEIEAIASHIETNLLGYEVDAYKDNVALARQSATVARHVIARVNNEDVWKVGSELPANETPALTDALVTVCDAPNDPSPAAVDPVKEQLEDDADFLTSLSTPITDDAVDPMADFDEDDIMFSN